MKGRGFLYVGVLLLTMTLLMLGMAFLSQQGPGADRSLQALEAAQAAELARAGFEDARIKLANDVAFPPNALDQPLFSYTEVMDLGSYRVVVDSRYARPNRVFLVTARGWTGPSGAPRAHASLTAWLDARTMQVVRWDE